MTVTHHGRPTKDRIVSGGAGPSVSLRRLARETGLSLSHVSRVFSGRRTPSIRAARLLADALKVDIDSLLCCLPCRPHEVRTV